MLDADDKRNLALMSFGAPRVADLIRAMDQKYGEKPEMKAVNATFSDLAKKNVSQLSALDDVLKKNPGLSQKIQDRLGRDPEAFRKDFLPAVFKDPQSAVSLVDQPLNAAPQPAAAKPPAQAANAPAAAPQTAAAPQPAAAPVAATSRLDAKMNKLMKLDGFDDLMDRVGKNPRLSDMFKGLMAGKGGDADKEAAIDKVLDQAKSDPQVLRKLVNTIDQKPGVVSSIAARMANDPQAGMAMLGLYSGITQNPFVQILGMIFGSALMDRMVMGVIDMVGGKLGNSKHLMVGASNNGMETVNKTLPVYNGKPDTVAVVDQSGQIASAAQATEQDKNRPAATGPMQVSPT